MNVDQILSSLSESSSRNNALQFLCDINVHRFQELVDQIVVIIEAPETIGNTNSFASLLVEFNRDEFVAPLIRVISNGVPGESPWLADYMYALNGVLGEQENLWEVDDCFVQLLGGWLLSTGGGEISWKSGDILSQIENQASREYLLKGAMDSSLFHMTRVSCLRGIVNIYGEDAPRILAMLVNDQDAHVKEAALDAKEFVDRRSGI